MSVGRAAAGAGGEISQVPVREGSPARWGSAVREFEAYREAKAGKYLVFVGDGADNYNEILAAPYTHRFTDAYTRREYARIQGFVRGAAREYTDPWVALLTFTAATTDERGEYRPPLDHLDELAGAWGRGTRYELSHVMEADRQKDAFPAREWEYLKIREPTTDSGYAKGGYAHTHVAVVADGRIGRERFRSVLEKHVEKCPGAKPEAHDVAAVDVRPMGDFANPGAYLAKYMGKSWEQDDETAYERRFNALLWESGRRRVQPSNGAQRWMQPDGSGGEADEPWVFAGIGEGDEIEHLRKYDDAGEFAIATETTVGEYLAGYPAREAVDLDGTDHRWVRGRCSRCGITEKQLVEGHVPYDGEPAECPGPPPPSSGGEVLKCGGGQGGDMPEYPERYGSAGPGRAGGSGGGPSGGRESDGSGPPDRELGVCRWCGSEAELVEVDGVETCRLCVGVACQSKSKPDGVFLHRCWECHEVDACAVEGGGIVCPECGDFSF